MFKVKLARNRDRPVFKAETEENRRGSSIGMVPSFFLPLRDTLKLIQIPNIPAHSGINLIPKGVIAR